MVQRQFSWRAPTYAEFFDKTSIKYYPFPSLTNTTQPQLKPGNLAGTVIDSITLRNHMTGDRVYISKTGAGVPVTHHSALNYLAVQNTPRLGGLQMQVGLTIHDDNVLSNYHDIFIPKAVKYSAGLLDYFFRGTIDVGLIGYDTNTMQYTNLIVNTSGQDFYGGAFYLLLETNGVRILIQSNSLSGTIASGASTNMIFPGPLPTNQSKLFLVYQGTIGVTNGNQALDPADANICIAANRVWIEQTKTYIYHPWLYEINLEPGDTITTNLESDDFPFTITPGNYEVEIIYTQFDDTGKIGSISADINYDSLCEEFRDISPVFLPADDVSISSDGKRLSVQISATDCFDRGGLIGWEPVIIEWKAWYGDNP